MVIRAGEAKYPHTNYKTSKYCVAYLDVLGFKNVILNDKNNKHLNILNMIFEDAIEEVYISKKIKNKDFFAKIFSDNILLATKTKTKDRIENIKLLCLVISNIIEEFLDYGYLMRGAIVEDDFFCNDTFVYGKALVDAVNMEKEYAIYPRIIVQENIEDVFPLYFYKSADGWITLNNYFVNDHGLSCYKFKASLLDLLKKNKDNKKAFQKIMWAIDYFNKYNNWQKANGRLGYCFISSKEISDALK